MATPESAAAFLADLTARVRRIQPKHWREERAGREASWWARAPRGPGAPTSGFFSGSRRPGSGAASSRWHERRLERRQRLLDGRDPGAVGPGGEGEVDLTDKVSTRRHTGPGQG